MSEHTLKIDAGEFGWNTRIWLDGAPLTNVTALTIELGVNNQPTAHLTLSFDAIEFTGDHMVVTASMPVPSIPVPAIGPKVERAS